MYEVIYSSESSIKNLTQLLRQMIRDLLASKELTRRLLIRNITAEYRESFFGAFWAFIPSLVTSGTFILLHHARVIRVGATDLPYAAYVIVSMTIWQTFVEALNGPILAIIGERSLISKQKIPVEAILIAKLGEILFNFVVRFSVVLCLLMWFRIPLHWTILWMPFALITLIAFGTSLGLILAPLNILYRDVFRGLTFFTSFWLFLTPVIYPQPRSGVFATLVRLNPVTPPLVAVRELATQEQLTQFTGLLIVSLITAFMIFFSWVIFRASLPYIEERMN